MSMKLLYLELYDTFLSIVTSKQIKLCTKTFSEITMKFIKNEFKILAHRTVHTYFNKLTDL